MKFIKQTTAGILALLMAISMAGCDEKKDSDSSSYQDQIVVPTTDAINKLSDSTDKELDYVSYDTNFLAGNAETPANIKLFYDKGGKINVIRTNQGKHHETMATLILSDNVPDVTTYEEQLTFPADIIIGLYQPIDSIVDFKSELWKDQKDLADKFTLNGKHYVAPNGYASSSILTYDSKLVEAEGIEDPYDTYLNGEWDWDAFYNVMKSYVSNAKGDEERYGLNGYYQRFIFASTGKSIVEFDEDKNEYKNNIKDPDLAKAADFIYKIRKEGLVLDPWIGNASSAFDAGCLFFAMGQWASINNNGPEDGDEWMYVPLPKMPSSDKQYTVVDMTTSGTLMWVKGSTKKEAVKCLLECSKICTEDSKLKKAAEDKFFANNKFVSKEQYNVINKEVVSNQFTPILDPGYGISNVLSSDSASTNAERIPIISQCYKLSNGDGDNKVYSWSQMIARNSNIIDNELKTFNEKLKNFIVNNK